MLFIVATNVVTSRPPERRPTGTPTARANIPSPICTKFSKVVSLSLAVLQVESECPRHHKAGICFLFHIQRRMFDW